MWKENIFKKYPTLRKIIFLLEKMDEKKANKILENIYRRLKNDGN